MIMKYDRKKAIRLSKHAKEQCKERGAKENEVKKAIMKSQWLRAKNNRYECKYNFQFDAEWNGKRYAIKEVKPIFVEEKNEIAVVTVYTYYN